MELTLDNLLDFLRKKYAYGDTFYSETILRDDSRQCPFDGIDAVDLLENLSKEFNMKFEGFDFHRHFLEESELDTLTWKHLFGLKKQREIKEELTVQMLFEYMTKNLKQKSIK